MEYTAYITYINPGTGNFSLSGPEVIPPDNGITYARKFIIHVDYTSANSQPSQYHRLTFRDPRSPNSDETLQVDTEIHEPDMHDPLIHQPDPSNPGGAVMTITDIAD
jgi:hypothetical protein